MDRTLYAFPMRGPGEPSRFPMPVYASSEQPTRPACAGFGMMGMTLLQLHKNDPSGLAGDGRSSMPARVFARISAACRLMHRAIVDAKIRRLQNELTFEDSYRKQPSCADDAARYPQRPLILGDKWDF
jgi:hypothetical protein